SFCFVGFPEAPARKRRQAAAKQRIFGGADFAVREFGDGAVDRDGALVFVRKGAREAIRACYVDGARDFSLVVDCESAVLLHGADLSGGAGGRKRGVWELAESGEAGYGEDCERIAVGGNCLGRSSVCRVCDADCAVWRKSLATYEQAARSISRADWLDGF